MPTNRASQALLSRIANTVIKEFGRDDLYVAQAPAGIGLSDAHLNLLQQLEQERLTDPASVARLVELSRIVDCVQDRSENVTLPTADPVYLSDIFQQLLDNVAFHNAPMSASDQHRYEQALAILYEEYPLLKQADYHEFCVLRVDLDKKDIVLLEMRQNLLRTQDASERALLESELATQQQLHNEQREVLDALDRAYNFRAAEAIVEAATRTVDQIPHSVRTMLDTIELLSIQDPITKDMHIACSFLPDHLAQDHWAPLRLTRAEIAQALPQAGATTATANELDEAEIDLIELEVQTVICERPWFWSVLFENTHWGWRTPSAPISTGAATGSTEELIPAYIYGLIFARNLKIKGRPSAKEHFKAIDLKRDGISNLLLRTLKPTVLRPIGIRPEITIPERPLVLQPLEPLVLQPLEPRLPTELGVDVDLPVRPWRRSEIRPGFALGDNLDVILNPKFNRLTYVHQQKLILQNLWLGIATYGQVVDEYGNGIYQVSVTLAHETGPRQVLTDKEGRFTFTLRQGHYAIRLEKDGFVPTKDALTVPQVTAPQRILMQQANVCPLQVRLLERVEAADRPFSGEAKLVISGANYERIEVMNGQAERQFRLPAGNFTITVVSSAATQITPASQQVSLAVGSNTVPLLSYTIFPAPMLSNPALQLLGFICRKVPRCP